MEPFALILAAAGRSVRFGDPRQKKVYAEIDGRAVWLRALDPFLRRPELAQVVVAIAREDRELFEARYRASVAFLNLEIVEGGAERSDTVSRALERLRPEIAYVAVHDAARPCVTVEQVAATFEAAAAHGAALLATPVTDTIKRSDDGRRTAGTVPRQGLYHAQTPQVFRRDWLVEAYARRSELGTGATDDTQLVEALGHPCTLVAGSTSNLKITAAEDLRLAAAILQSREKSARPAASHPFAEERAGWDDLPKLKPSDLFKG